MGRGRNVQPEHLHLVRSGRNQRPCRLPDRPPHRHDDGGGDLRLADGACLHDRLHGGRRWLPAFLQLYRAVHLLHADAGDEQQLPAAVLRLGSGGSGVLSADRFLVQAADRDFRQHEGVFGQPRRRLRFPARHRRRAAVVRRFAGLQRRVCPCAGPGIRHGRANRRTDCRTSLACRQHRLHLPVHRRHGQVCAGSPACVVAGLDGRPDPDLGPDPCRDHGHCRHLHGGAHVTVVRAERNRAHLRAGDWCHHGPVHRLDRCRAERHQARGCLFNTFATGLHDCGAGRLGVFRRRVSPDDARLLQGAAVPRCRFGDHCHAP